MACTAYFTVDDGTTTVTVRSGSLTEAFSIQREVLEDGLDHWRAADGSAALYVRYEARRYVISGAGPADPGLYALDLTADTWEVIIPGFADGSANETWTVIPARPVQTRDRRGTSHNWSVTFESAAAV